MKINQENLKNISKKTLFEYQKLFPVLKKEKNRQYGMVALTFIALTVFGIFAINPTLTTIVELQKKLEDARFVEQQLSQKILSLQTLRQQYTSLQPNLIIVNRALPTKPQPVRFIGQVQTIANTSSITISSFQIEKIQLTGQTEQTPITPEAPSGDGETVDIPLDAIEKITPTTPTVNVNSYAFSLTVTGTYPQVHTFLKDLTSFDRITTVDKIGISRGSTDTSIVSMALEGTTFFKP